LARLFSFLFLNYTQSLLLIIESLKYFRKEDKIISNAAFFPYLFEPHHFSMSVAYLVFSLKEKVIGLFFFDSNQMARISRKNLS